MITTLLRLIILREVCRTEDVLVWGAEWTSPYASALAYARSGVTLSAVHGFQWCLEWRGIVRSSLGHQAENAANTLAVVFPIWYLSKTRPHLNLLKGS